MDLDAMVISNRDDFAIAQKGELQKKEKGIWRTQLRKTRKREAIRNACLHL